MADAELLQLTPVYETVEGGWTQATFRELPGVVTTAPTRSQAEADLVDALREFFRSFGPGDAPVDAAPSLAVTLRPRAG